MVGNGSLNLLIEVLERQIHSHCGQRRAKTSVWYSTTELEKTSFSSKSRGSHGSNPWKHTTKTNKKVMFPDRNFLSFWCRLLIEAACREGHSSWTTSDDGRRREECARKRYDNMRKLLWLGFLLSCVCLSTSLWGGKNMFLLRLLGGALDAYRLLAKMQ